MLCGFDTCNIGIFNKTMCFYSMWFLYNVNPYNVYIYNVYLSIYGEISGNIVFLYLMVCSIQEKTECNILYKVCIFILCFYIM